MKLHGTEVLLSEKNVKVKKDEQRCQFADSAQNVQRTFVA